MGIDFHAECLPAWEVGGDCYDVFPMQGGRVAIVMGDISGKGMPAALLMGLLHRAVQTAAAFSDGAGLDAQAHLINSMSARLASTSRRSSWRCTTLKLRSCGT
jgi:hypothetical protein